MTDQQVPDVTPSPAKPRVKSFFRSAIIAASVVTLSLVILIAYFWGWVLGAAIPNEAKGDAKQSIGKLENAGYEVKCDNGDNGHSMDNTEPWYSATLVGPKVPPADILKILDSTDLSEVKIVNDDAVRIEARSVSGELTARNFTSTWYANCSDPDEYNGQNSLPSDSMAIELNVSLPSTT